jgi:hypothetical protein
VAAGLQKNRYFAESNAIAASDCIECSLDAVAAEIKAIEYRKKNVS